MNIVKDAAMAVMKKAVEHAPDAWMPGGKPDPLIARKHGVIGTPVSRLDGPLKVQGQARFAAEFPMQGMAYAALAFSTIAKGRIATLDTSEAEAAPGVVLMMTHKNAPRMKKTPLFGSNPKAAGGDDLPVMQDDKIHWNGEPIALVLAETQEQADHAKSLIRATYDVEPSTTSFAAAKAEGLKAGEFQGEPLKLEIGDAEKALAEAPHQIDVIYTTPRQNHNPIELHAATLAWKQDDKGDDELTDPRRFASAWRTYGLVARTDLRHRREAGPRHVGRMWAAASVARRCGSIRSSAAAAAKLAGRPVRVVLSREGVYRDGRRAHGHRAAGGDRRAGGWPFRRADPHRRRGRHDAGTTTCPSRSACPPAAPTPPAASSLTCETGRTLDMLANTFMRAPGEAVGSFGHWNARVDELAVADRDRPYRAEDAATSRRRTRLPAGRSPRGISSRHIGREPSGSAGAHGAPPNPAQRREGEWLIGMGVRDGHLPLLPDAGRCRADHCSTQ